MLKEAGIGFGDRVCFLLPHSVEHMVWIQAAKRVGAICTCLPESISIASLAGRLFDVAASLCVTSSAKSAMDSADLRASHKAMVLHAIMDYVSMEAVLRTIKRVLPEQRWRTSQGKVDIKGVCETIEASFKGDGAVSPKTVAAKLEVIFSMQPPLRERAEELAAHLQEEMVREHASRLKTRVMVVPNPFAKQGSPPESSVPSTAPSTAPSPAPSRFSTSPGPPRRPQPGQSAAGSGHSAARVSGLQLRRAQRAGDAAVARGGQARQLRRAPCARGPRDGGDDLEGLAVRRRGVDAPEGHRVHFWLVREQGDRAGAGHGRLRLGRVQHDENLLRRHAGRRRHLHERGAVVGDGANLWPHRPARDACHLGARHGHARGDDGPVPRQCGAAAQGDHLRGPASFLKRALKNSWQAAWLQRQRLDEHLRVAASCGEPLSPAMHKLGMAVLCPNYINSYWASEHGAILASASFGNAEPVTGNAEMFALPWVNAAVWLPGGRQRGRRIRFTQAEPPPAEDAKGAGGNGTAMTNGSRVANGGVDGKAAASATGGLSKVSADLQGRLVVTKPWPSMARTVWGDAEEASRDGWVGDLDTYRQHYWSTFARDDGEPVMALDLADLACPHSNGSISVLGHSREEFRLGIDRVVVAAAELEATLLSASTDVIDAVVVALPDRESNVKPGEKPPSIPIACLVLPEGVSLTDELTNTLKRAVHVSMGASCVPEDFVQIPAIPRTHNAKPMRNVVQRLFC